MRAKAIKIRYNQGFSLLEILVAFSIMALAIGVLLRIFSGGVRTTAIADDYTRAVLIAESQLALVGVEEELEEGEAGGTVEDRFHWTTTVAEFQSAEENFEVEQLPMKPFQVQVTVEWGDGQRKRSFVLHTLRLKSPLAR